MRKGKANYFVIFIPVQDVIITQFGIIGRYWRAKVYVHNISCFIVKNMQIFYMAFFTALRASNRLSTTISSIPFSVYEVYQF